MGGLDARYFVTHLKGHLHVGYFFYFFFLLLSLTAISKFDDNQVASISTIGTPHKGSALADIGSKIATLTKVRILFYISF